MSLIDVILVPQGAEFNAVRRGLQQPESKQIAAKQIAVKQIVEKQPIAIPIPVGVAAVSQVLQQGLLNRWHEPSLRVLVMGLCGSLAPAYQVGDAVLYQECWQLSESGKPEVMFCDRSLTQQIQSVIQPDHPLALVKAWTSDRILATAQEKQSLAQTYELDVVDMEAMAVLQNLPQARIAMLRVVSDDSQHNIPDLTAAINANGALSAQKMAMIMAQQPIASFRMIRGALRALAVLESLSRLLLQ